MKQLKTLKDIKEDIILELQLESNLKIKDRRSYEDILFNLLRQEAIKDWKTHNRLMNIWAKQKNVINVDQHRAVMSYIKWKNNLTKEDLK